MKAARPSLARGPRIRTSRRRPPERPANRWQRRRLRAAAGAGAGVHRGTAGEGVCLREREGAKGAGGESRPRPLPCEAGVPAVAAGTPPGTRLASRRPAERVREGLTLVSPEAVRGDPDSPRPGPRHGSERGRRERAEAQPPKAGLAL